MKYIWEDFAKPGNALRLGQTIISDRAGLTFPQLIELAWPAQLVSQALIKSFVILCSRKEVENPKMITYCG
ncbi:hypothetical protein PanWU01x14_296120 [Parasponia andersonii]|uniref:Uncharacterized protein n=1 Tax=Parasponia andersonii TaxID=3476 RepID=A0A2P5AVJ5_PARAD|nr:hypothetical protein PanWU01x14_296120 [Parasponia andersonii]